MRAFAALAVISLAAAPVFAQDNPPTAEPEQHGPRLQVTPGPVEGALGSIATVQVPEGYGFVAKDQMPTLNEVTGNLNNPNDVGAVLAKEGWLVFFTWDDIGFVKDDDKDDLDADELLETFQDNEDDSNAARQEAGFSPMYIVGWQTPPHYDAKTNNLTWALKNRIGSRDSTTFNINHEVRVLGRRGAMSAVLVAEPEQLDGAVKELDGLLDGFAFNPGSKYSEYTEGDKVAAYGLTGLVLGGGALLAAKTGLLAKLGRFIKFIVLGVGAAIAGVWKKVKDRFAGRT